MIKYNNHIPDNMKTTMKRVALIALLLGSFAGSLTAQERLKRVVERCEASPNARTMNLNRGTVRTNGTGDNQTSGHQLMKTITINNDDALVNDVVAAFEADKGKAKDLSESTNNGLLSSFECVFEEGENKNLTYRFNRTPSGASLIVQESTGGIDAHPHFHFEFSSNMEPVRIHMEDIRLQADSIRVNIERNFDQDKMDSLKREMERMKDEMQRTLREYQEDMQQMLQEVRRDLQENRSSNRN